MFPSQVLFSVLKRFEYLYTPCRIIYCSMHVETWLWNTIQSLLLRLRIKNFASYNIWYAESLRKQNGKHILGGICEESKVSLRILFYMHFSSFGSGSFSTNTEHFWQTSSYTVIRCLPNQIDQSFNWTKFWSNFSHFMIYRDQMLGT